MMDVDTTCCLAIIAEHDAMLLTQFSVRYQQITVAYQSLDLLQEHGISVTDIQKLNDAGYFTVESVRISSMYDDAMLVLASSNYVYLMAILQIAHATARRLSDVKGISEAKVMKLKEIVKSMVPMDFKTAADALEDRK